MMGNSVGNILKIVGKRKGNSGSGVVHKSEERVILGGSVGRITKNQGGTQILVGVEDARRHRGAAGGCVTCALSSAPERFIWWVVSTEFVCDTICCFYMVSHTLMNFGMETEVGEGASDGAESEVGVGFDEAIITTCCVFICDGSWGNSHA